MISFTEDTKRFIERMLDKNKKPTFKEFMAIYSWIGKESKYSLQLKEKIKLATQIASTIRSDD